MEVEFAERGWIVLEDLEVEQEVVLEQQAKSRVDPNTQRGRGATTGAASGAPTVKPKVVLRERDSSDPRDNRKSSTVILRPSSASAASRTITPSRTVQLEAPQQPEPARQVFVEEQPQSEIGEGAASGAPHPAEGQPTATVREDLEEAEEEEEEPNERSRSEPPKLRPRFPRESPTSRPLGLRPRVAGYPEIRFDSVGTWALIAPAPKAPETTLVGAKSSRRVNPSPKPGVHGAQAHEKAVVIGSQHRVLSPWRGRVGGVIVRGVDPSFRRSPFNLQRPSIGAA